MAWVILCNWWYLCKIKNLCNGETVGVLQAATPSEAMEPALVENEAAPRKEKAAAASDDITPPKAVALEKAELSPPSTFTTLFQFDSDAIRVSSELSDWLSEIQSQSGQIQRVRIIGHTCELGTKSYNHELGLRRASAVKQLMIEQGFSVANIEVESQGKEAPLNTNATDQDREQNRRAEIMIN